MTERWTEAYNLEPDDLPELETFLAEQRRQQRPRTVLQGYRQELASFALWFRRVNGEPCTAETVRQGDVANYLGFLVRTRRQQTTAVSQSLGVLRRFLQWAADAGLIEPLPTEAVAVPRPPARPTGPRRGAPGQDRPKRPPRTPRAKQAPEAKPPAIPRRAPRPAAGPRLAVEGGRAARQPGSTAGPRPPRGPRRPAGPAPRRSAGTGPGPRAGVRGRPRKRRGEA
ncbi:MAG: site-specific integrase [Chloroflexi bacterium]|nr:site-specific integrase [Chloroflexota bacterium]